MRGSARSCLLALLCVVVSPGSLTAQSDRNDLRPTVVPNRAPNPATDFAPGAVPPPAFPPPSPDPIREWPHHPVSPSGTFGLSQLAHSAGMIFSATVINVARRPATQAQAFETVAITFHVQDAIRGATPGEDLPIKQWIGLWSSGQRYHIGEHALFFLYPPSKLGLTSCVGGAMGRFAIDPRGRVLLSAQQVSAFRQDPVLGGKSRVSFRDFALAVRQASGEKWTSTTTR